MSSTIFGALQDQATNAYQHMSSVFSSASSHAYTLIPSVPDYGAASFSTNPVLPPDATKIEPKVFLASERTFLTWLRVAVLISTFALALFNSAAPGDWVAKGMGFTYATVAIGVIGYAWVMHEKRRTRIIGRYAGHHGTHRFPPGRCTSSDHTSMPQTKFTGPSCFVSLFF